MKTIKVLMIFCDGKYRYCFWDNKIKCLFFEFYFYRFLWSTARLLRALCSRARIHYIVRVFCLHRLHLVANALIISCLWVKANGNFAFTAIPLTS